MNTTYFKNMIMGNVFGTKTSPAIPSEYYLGLSTTAPSKDGSNVTEPTSGGSGYARVKITDLSEPTDGVISSTAPIEFPESTSDWGTITNYVIFDGLTEGNLLMYGELENSRHVDQNTVVTFRTGGLTITLDDLATG